VTCSPSCDLLSTSVPRFSKDFSAQETYAFYPRQMRSGVEVCEQDFLAETGGQDLAIVAGGYGTACVNWLDHATRLEGGLDICLVGHSVWSDALPPASLFGPSLSS
jgi:hypothetical protein